METEIQKTEHAYKFECINYLDHFLFSFPK